MGKMTGNEFLVKIRESNDAIPGEEISAKISKMEIGLCISPVNL